jgi:hypothetical protein
VLCNFDKAYRAIDPEKADRKKFREAVFTYKIFEDLEFMPDAQQLLNFVSKLDGIHIEILTSMGTFDAAQGNEAKMQKIKWLNDTNIPYRPNFVRSKEEKSKYATPTSILIDDSIGCIKPFNVAGGTGILHTSARESIEQLSRTIDIISGVHALRRIKL